MLFCCCVRRCVKEARACVFAVHESSAPCASNCRASKPVALDFCGKTLQDFRVQQPSVSPAKLIKRVLQEPVAFKGSSFARSCWDTTRYDRPVRDTFCPRQQLLGFLHVHEDKIMEEQISRECLHCPDAACCVVRSAFVEVEPLLARHQRKESGDVV